MKLKNRKTAYLIVLFFLSILIFSVFVIAAARSGSVIQNCPDKLCQIDEVWTIMQDKLVAKNKNAGKDTWLGKKVWQGNEWKTFEQVYSRAGGGLMK